jgi:hypothetical protein
MGSFAGRNSGYIFRNDFSKVPSGTATRTSRNGCTVHLFQRICCFLAIRRATISLIALVAMGDVANVRADCPHAQPDCLIKLADVYRWTKAKSIADVEGGGTLRHHLRDLIAYLEAKPPILGIT